MFFSIRITLTRGICFWQPYQIFSKTNTQLLSPEVRDCEAYILNRSPFQNLLLGRRNAQMKSLLETCRSQSEKFFSKSGKIGEFWTSKNNFFPGFYTPDTLKSALTALLGTFEEKFETFSPKSKNWFEITFLCKNCSPRNFFRTLRRKVWRTKANKFSPKFWDFFLKIW